MKENLMLVCQFENLMRHKYLHCINKTSFLFAFSQAQEHSVHALPGHFEVKNKNYVCDSRWWIEEMKRTKEFLRKMLLPNLAC